MSYADGQKEREREIAERARKRKESEQETMNNFLRHSMEYREALGFFDDETRLSDNLYVEVQVATTFHVDDGVIGKESDRPSYFKDGDFFEREVIGWSPNGMVPLLQFLNRGRVHALIFELYSLSRCYQKREDRHVRSVLSQRTIRGFLSESHIFAGFSAFKCLDSGASCPQGWNEYKYELFWEDDVCSTIKGCLVDAFAMSIVSEEWHKLIVRQILKQWPH